MPCSMSYRAKQRHIHALDVAVQTVSALWNGVPTGAHCAHTVSWRGDDAATTPATACFLQHEKLVNDV